MLSGSKQQSSKRLNEMTLMEQNRSLWKHLHRVEFLLAQQIQQNKRQKKYFNKKIGKLAKVLDNSFGVDPAELNEALMMKEDSQIDTELDLLMKNIQSEVGQSSDSHAIFDQLNKEASSLNEGDSDIDHLIDERKYLESQEESLTHGFERYLRENNIKTPQTHSTGGVHISNGFEGTPSKGPSLDLFTIHDGSNGLKESKKKRKNSSSSANVTNTALWTEEDNLKFIELFGKHGTAWKEIQKFMDGKTREQIQSHGRHLIKSGKLQPLKQEEENGKKKTSRKNNSSGKKPKSVKEEEVAVFKFEPHPQQASTAPIPNFPNPLLGLPTVSGSIDRNMYRLSS